MDEPDGMTIHQIRERFPQAANNENLSRRLRELRKTHDIPFNKGVYKYHGPRADPTKDDGYIPERLRSEVFQRDGHRCRFCGKTPAIDGVRLNADHMTPHSLGGTTTIDNLQTLCEPCNRAKKNHFVSDNKFICTTIMACQLQDIMLVSDKIWLTKTDNEVWNINYTIKKETENE